jgi:hypothetical protein
MDGAVLGVVAPQAASNEMVAMPSIARMRNGVWRLVMGPVG